MIRLGGITVAKRVTKKVNSTELDSKEFFAAIAQIVQRAQVGRLERLAIEHLSRLGGELLSLIHI